MNPHASPRRRDAGVTTLEWTGLVVIAAVIVAGIVAAMNPGQIRETTSAAICRVLGGSCDLPQMQAPDPNLTPEQKAKKGKLVVHGDSFSSGEGAGDYDPNTDKKNPWWKPWQNDPENKCHRSRNSYANKTNETIGFEGGITFNACSGAKHRHFQNQNSDNNEREQFPDQPDPDASVVAWSMGGNDMGFADILENCITRGLRKEGCQDTGAATKKRQQYFGDGSRRGKIDDDIQKAKQLYPNARIVIMGYPELFAEKPLKDGWKPQWNGSGMSLEDQKWANAETRKVNQALREMAERNGIEFVDPNEKFHGPGYDHRIGSDDPWLNGLQAPPECFHPNAKGQQAMSDALVEQIRNGK